MSIVFQLGNATITNDVILGWVVGKNGSFFAISDMDEVSLHELATATYPPYLDEFKEACASQLELLLKAKEEQSRTGKELLLKVVWHSVPWEREDEDIDETLVGADYKLL